MSLSAMQILSVTLKNFKTHRDRFLEFQAGTNAICGENGAGKTSVLDAIAWVLFNYQGDYSKEDLIRNGSGSAQVTVAFVSSRDERIYEVQRCTQKGYTLFDPQLNERLPYTRIKDEVLPWLRQHLGVKPGTDLAQLFGRTLGVPQGTFTLDFLLTAENRKKVFDAILNVEEYKAAFKQMNGLRRYAEAQVEATTERISQYDETLKNWDDLKARYQDTLTQHRVDEAALASLEKELESLQARRQTLQAQAQKIQAYQQEIQALQAKIESQTQLNERLATALKQADAAATLCEQHQPAYEIYQAAEALLQTLNQQQQKRQTLQKRYQAVQTQGTQRQADLTRLQVKLESLQQVEADLQALSPAISEQARLEEQLQELQTQQQALQQQHLQHQSLKQQAEQWQQRFQENQKALQGLSNLQPDVDEIGDLEQQCDRIQQQLSRIQAARQFEAELRQLVSASHQDWEAYHTQSQQAIDILLSLQDSTPLLTTEAVEVLQTAIESGRRLNQTLIADLNSILQDLSTQTDAPALKTTLRQQRQLLEQRYQYRAELAQLPRLQQQQVDTQQKIETLQAQLLTLTQQMEAAADVPAQIQAISASLRDLDNPRGQTQRLQKALEEKDSLQRNYENRQAAQQQLQAQLQEMTAQLETFAELDQQVTQQQTLKQTHTAGYLCYLQNQQTAQSRAQVAADLHEATEILQGMQQQLHSLSTEFEAVNAEFDPQAQAQLETTYGDLKSQADQLAGSLPQQQKLLQELQQQLDLLDETAQKRDATMIERKQREKVRRFVNFARKVYKEAGPRITECYVQTVSREADRLFRELLNRPNVALEWTRDYEILVQEGPNKRRFLNLSGGEQMCAALAVRLALLKVLADVDVAFFDEPTTNMDRLRRQSLAEAIGRIKSFRQLFVISHDDTFEQVTENVVILERQVT